MGTTALSAARAAVKSLAVAGGKISSPEVVSVSFDVHEDSDGNRIEISSLTPPDPDNPGSPESDLNNAPTVKVCTKLVVTLPAPILFSAAGFTDSITLHSQYVFLIIHAADDSDDDSNDELDAETETADGPDETSDVPTTEE